MGGAGPCWAPPAKLFAGRRFVPPRHFCLAETKWRRCQEHPSKLSRHSSQAQTHARVFGGFSAKQGTLSPPSLRSASSSIIPFRRLLPRRRLCWLCRLHLPSGSLLPLPIGYSCAFAAATLMKMGAALNDWLLIRFHRRQQEALYPSSLSTSYPLGPGVLVVFALWNSICRLRPQLWPLSRISTAALRAGFSWPSL